MKTSEITKQFPGAAKEFDEWLRLELKIDEFLFDRMYWLTRIATLNGFLGYSMDTVPYMNMNQDEAFNEIINKFRLLEEALPYKISEYFFVRWILDIDIYDMEKHFPGINQKLTRDCIADCAVMFRRRTFISECTIYIQKRKSILDCVTPLIIPKDEYIRKFWEESIKFSWRFKQGLEVCPF